MHSTRVIAVHDQGSAAHELADLHFFGPVVRMHRAGEGAPYTGLKPPGLDHGHVIPVAEHAIESGSPGELVSLLTGRVEHEVRSHFKQVMELKAPAEGDLDANRACVEAMFDLQAWSHSLYQTTKASAHEHDHVHAEWAMFRCACCGRRREGSIHIGTTDHTCVVGVPVLVSEGRT